MRQRLGAAIGPQFTLREDVTVGGTRIPAEAVLFSARGDRGKWTAWDNFTWDKWADLRLPATIYKPRTAANHLGGALSRLQVHPASTSTSTMHIYIHIHVCLHIHPTPASACHVLHLASHHLHLVDLNKKQICFSVAPETK